MRGRHRIVVAEPGAQGHDRGVEAMARALRDAGFEVVYAGPFRLPAEVAEVALQEDAAAVGLFLPPGTDLALVTDLVAEVRARHLDDVVVFARGDLPAADAAALAQAGAPHVFTSEATLASLTDWLTQALPADVAHAP